VIEGTLSSEVADKLHSQVETSFNAFLETAEDQSWNVPEHYSKCIRELLESYKPLTQTA
jgi:hypothetical protein